MATWSDVLYTQVDIDAAVKAEREACAEIANSYVNAWQSLLDTLQVRPDKLIAALDQAKVIAAAIRERKP